MPEIYLIKVENICINNSTQNIEHGQEVYTGIGSFKLKNYNCYTSLQPNECEFEFIFTESLHTKEEIFQTFHGKNATVVKSEGSEFKTLINGTISEITIKTGIFTVKIKSNIYKFSKPMTKKYSQTCRASFCDSNCKLNIANYTHTFLIQESNGFDITLYETPQRHTWQEGFGVINKLTYKIQSIEKNVVKFFEEVKCKPGDTLIITPSCNKTMMSCKHYNNIKNFQGEPFIL
jgi:uncharacterized phage protein (TIGR02218 family)